MAPVSCVSVACCFPASLFQSQMLLSLPGALTSKNPSTRILLKHKRTHLYWSCTHTPAPPQSLIYSYLMLWCHNSLSGSLAWQPFVMHCSWGGKRIAAVLFPQPPHLWGWNKFVAQLMHTDFSAPHPTTHAALWSTWLGDGYKGDELPCALLRSQGSKWHIEMRERWKHDPSFHSEWHFRTPVGDGGFISRWYILLTFPYFTCPLFPLFSPFNSLCWGSFEGQAQLIGAELK